MGWTAAIRYTRSRSLQRPKKPFSFQTCRCVFSRKTCFKQGSTCCTLRLQPPPAGVANDELTRYLRQTTDRFSYSVKEAALYEAECYDGKLVLLTNIDDFSAERLVERYKSPADIERGFRLLKSDLEIVRIFR
jgi:IS4 transposase